MFIFVVFFGSIMRHSIYKPHISYIKKSSNLDTIFYYMIDTMYIHSWIKSDKILIHFGDAN